MSDNRYRWVDSVVLTNFRNREIIEVLQRKEKGLIPPPLNRRQDIKPLSTQIITQIISITKEIVVLWFFILPKPC